MMSQFTPTIRSVKARAVVTPLKRPVKNAFGVFVSAPLVLIDVATDQGVTGRAFRLSEKFSRRPISSKNSRRCRTRRSLQC
jgi:hypothetical protein